MRAKSIKTAWAAAILWTLGSGGLAAKPAEIEVGGFGWLKNREMRQALDALLGDGGKRDAVDASFLEDAALVLNSELVDAGYFDARILVTWTDASGETGSGEVDAQLSRPLSRPLTATRARLEARPGRRAVMETVKFEGLEALEVPEAESFFSPRWGFSRPMRRGRGRPRGPKGRRRNCGRRCEREATRRLVLK